MSGRGAGGGRARGRGGGRRAQQSDPSAGRGGGGGRGQGRGRGANPPPSPGLSSAAPPSGPSSAASSSSSPSYGAIAKEMEQKLTLQPSSSSQPQAVAPVVPQQLPPSSSKALTNPRRPGFGTFGQKMLVKANHFLVKVADRDLTHYDVTISPEVLVKKRCRQIMNQLVETFHVSHLGKKLLAYDGRKSCYSAGELPFKSKDFVVKLVDKDGGRREQEYKVIIKFASKADLHHLNQFLQGRQFDVPQETVQCLDVVLRQGPSNSYEVVGRSFFGPSLGRKGELGNGLEYWKGFYQSLRPTQMGLSLNIDMSARGFFEPILVTDFVGKYLNKDLSRSLPDQDRIKLKKALKNVKVETNHLGHIIRYRVSGFSNEPVQQLMFNSDEFGGKISVAQYFNKKYKIHLRYTSMPAVMSGNETKPVYLPMEMCRIAEGQRYTKRLNERQVTALLKATCQRPWERERDITEMVRRNNYNGDVLVNEGFGIQISSELTKIEARVLPPPRLKYHDTGKEKFVNPRVGQWNMIGKKMVNGGRVEHWACITFSRANVDVRRFCSELISMCCSKGMDFNPQPVVPFSAANPAQIEKALCDIHAASLAKLKNMPGKQLQLLIVILPDYSGSYGKIKTICETELGIVSQCCQPRQAMKYNIQYMENVALKINVKVGGRNTVLEQALLRKMPYICERPTIIFGADVTHPQPGEDSSPSIAAVVASMDWPEVTKYRGLVSAQTHREEMIQDLYSRKENAQKGVIHGGLIRDHLIAYFKSTKQKPHRIIFYRDGVSEGQFSQVLLHEMDAIRRACVSLEEGYLPKVTFVVVQKRHHTRLFPADHDNRQTTDKSGNILPGTVVDTTICHPTEFDFYLCSHAGIQGTSRPTHYHVLYDENGFTADGLQILTNSLCYTYARCTRSVSIVPPAYYAHLAAFRARYYLEGMYDSDSGSTSRGATRERNIEVRPLPMIKENVKEVMFYC